MFMNILNSIVLLLTLVVISYYTYETYKLRKLTEANSRNSARPILIMHGEKPISLQNCGAGPAINICLMLWTGKIMKVVPENEIPQILPVDGKFHFPHFADTDMSRVKTALPHSSSILEKVVKRPDPLVLAIYTDIYGSKYYSLLNTENKNYQEAIELGTLS